MREFLGFFVLAGLALVWGFAEAVWFFLVADIVITLMAARLGFYAGRTGAFLAAIGAMFGGLVVYIWAGTDPAGVEHALDAVPAVSAAQIAAVKLEMQQDWLWALLRGGFVGNPYKLYAAAAGELRIPMHWFWLASLAARLARFFLAAIIAHLLAAALRRLGQERAIVPLWAIAWVGFYAWYFSVTPG